MHVDLANKGLVEIRQKSTNNENLISNVKEISKNKILNIVIIDPLDCTLDVNA